MALKIVVNFGKTLPGSQEFSSVRATCALESEVAAGQDPGVEACRLFQEAERVVDRQLGIGQQATSSIGRSVYQPQPTPNGNGANPSSQGHGRAAPVSPAQVRFLLKLVTKNQISVPQLLAEHGVDRLEALSSRAASSIIDRLKS